MLCSCRIQRCHASKGLQPFFAYGAERGLLVDCGLAFIRIEKFLTCPATHRLPAMMQHSARSSCPGQYCWQRLRLTLLLSRFEARLDESGAIHTAVYGVIIS